MDSSAPAGQTQLVQSAPTRPLRFHMLLLPAILAAGCMLIYWQTRDHGFVNYDDALYVVRVPELEKGLTWDGLRWAFSHPIKNYPQPLTHLSLLIDTALFGPDAAGYHLTNVLIHTASTLVLFLILASRTRRPLASFAVAAVFGWHPTHAESVAWISERKDVLSVFFGLMTIAGYGFWSLRKKASYALTVALPFACALLSKPSMVMLPCVLMLLDIWPLHRVPLDDRTGRSSFDWLLATIRGMLHKLPEKIPLFLMSGLIAMAAWEMGGARANNAPWDLLPPAQRLIHCVSAYAFYVKKFFIPLDLAPLHLHPRVLPPLAPIVGWSLVFCLVTLLAFSCARRAPAALAGWLWFLGVLLPVSGILQSGLQLVANRYTYFAYIGLAIAVFFPLAGILSRSPLPLKTALHLCVACWLAWLAHHSRSVDVPVWKDSITLWTHAVEVEPHSEVALHNLAKQLEAEQRLAEALVYAEAAKRRAPGFRIATKQVERLHKMIEEARLSTVP